MPKVEGTLKNIVYHNKENNYQIIRLDSTEEKIVTVVGYFNELSKGLSYCFEGEYVYHKKFGMQFNALNVNRLDNDNIEGLVIYLSSNNFSGIGPKTARKIVEKLGVNCLEMIIKNPKSIEGLGLSNIRILKLRSELIENKNQEKLSVSLLGLGFSHKLTSKIIDKYGSLAVEKIKEDPYRIIYDIDQIGFIKADEIAKKIGIKPNDKRRIKAAIIYTFENRMYKSGDTYLTKQQISYYIKNNLKINQNIDDIIEELITESLVVKNDDKYTIQNAYYSAKRLANKLRLLNQFEKNVNNNMDYINVLELKKGITYTEIQKEAILTSLSNPITIITGGPGTGKTTIIDGIIDFYRYKSGNIERHELYEKILIMAPTGRASKRLQEVLDFPAKTIHSSLGFNFDGSFKHNEFSKLKQELIIIDEASMIDIFLATKLFDAIEKKSKVIIVGDSDQLRSVGPGQFLDDCIKSKLFPVVKLIQIHRQARDSRIIKLSQKVNSMNISLKDLNSEEDLFIYKCKRNMIFEVILNQIDDALKKGYCIYKDIQVLIPIYKGNLGIDNFNFLIQEKLNKNNSQVLIWKEKKFYKGDKVIQLINEPNLGIMNGDIGTVHKIIRNDSEEYQLVVSYDGNEVVYNKNDLDQITLAYAISVHKSQGSEYKIVIMPLVETYSHMLKKELIYTGITRAKNVLLIIGEPETLIKASNKKSTQRQTLLSFFLKNKNQKNKKTMSPYDFLE